MRYWLACEFQAKQGYIVRSCLKNKREERKTTDFYIIQFSNYINNQKKKEGILKLLMDCKVVIKSQRKILSKKKKKKKSKIHPCSPLFPGVKKAWLEQLSSSFTRNVKLKNNTALFKLRRTYLLRWKRLLLVSRLTFKGPRKSNETALLSKEGNSTLTYANTILLH